MQVNQQNTRTYAMHTMKTARQQKEFGGRKSVLSRFKINVQYIKDH